MPLDKQRERLLEMFEEALESAFEDEDGEEEDSIPYQVLNFPDESNKWVLDPVRKKMVMAKHNTEVVQISSPDKDNKVLVRALGGNFLFIPLDYVQDIGFN